MQKGVIYLDTTGTDLPIVLILVHFLGAKPIQEQMRGIHSHPCVQRPFGQNQLQMLLVHRRPQATITHSHDPFC